MQIFLKVGDTCPWSVLSLWQKQVCKFAFQQNTSFYKLQWFDFGTVKLMKSTCTYARQYFSYVPLERLFLIFIKLHFIIAPAMLRKCQKHIPIIG